MPDDKQRLTVIWSSGDPGVAWNTCLLYAHNARLHGWFDQVNLVVWGPSAKLLSGDIELQGQIRLMMRDGVVVEACVTCSNNYGVSERLRELGIDVKPMGVVLSDRLKTGWRILNF